MTQLSIDQLSDINPEVDDAAPAAPKATPTGPICAFSTRHPVDDIWAPKVKCNNPARYIISDKQNRDKQEQVRREAAYGHPLDDAEKAGLPHTHHLAICASCWDSRAKISDWDILEDLVAVEG